MDTLEKYLASDPHNTYVRIELARILAYSLENKRASQFQLDIVLDLEPDNTDALKASVTVRQNDRTQSGLVDDQYRHLIELLEKKNDRTQAA